MSGYDIQFEEPLHIAIQKQDINTAGRLLQRGHDANALDYSACVPLTTVAWYGVSVDYAKLLLSHGADPSGHGSALFPLIEGARRGRRELVGVLLKAGANINAVDEEEQTALMIAIANRHDEIALDLLAAGADYLLIDRDGETAVSYAKQYACDVALEMIEKLAETKR